MSLLPAPTPVATTCSTGKGPQPLASAVTSATPVGVASSPGPPPDTVHPLTISSTAGTGTGRTPCSALTVPEPSASGLAWMAATPRSWRPAQLPTTSAIESSAPTS